MAKLKLSAPWEQYYSQVTALFGKDPEIHIIFDEDEMDLKLYVETVAKAEALKCLFPTEKIWGDVALSITVIPPNSNFKIVREGDMTPREIIECAFYANPHFSRCVKIDLPIWGGFTYIMFTNEVIQYYTDNLADRNGVTSTLAQDIAKEIFEPIDGVYYCTELKDYIKKVDLAESFFSSSKN